MSSEACFLALNSALNEVKHVCPNVQHAFLFTADAQLVAKDYVTDEAAADAAAQAIQALSKHAHAFGGLDSFTFQGENHKVTITGLNEFYLATIADCEVDEQSLRNLIHVVIPTVIKVLQTVNPNLTTKSPTENQFPPEPEGLDNEPQAPTMDLTSQETPAEIPEPVYGKSEPEPTLPEAPASQLMVETLSGLGLVTCSENVVRVDREVLSQWKNFYGDQKILEVEVEEPQVGKKLRCHFKPVRDPRLEGKGVIQISEKLQQLLEIRKGALVTVRPVFTEEENT
jgi:predicted regulator of Ras-like GTPase activity (Roadblock/LC7/MglB family)